MFEPLLALFKDGPKHIQASDLKYLVQNYLREQLKTEAIHCHSVQDGIAVVRTTSPTLHQEIRLLEHDLKQELAKEAKYELKAVKVIK